MYRISKTTGPIATRSRSGYRTYSHSVKITIATADVELIIILAIAIKLANETVKQLYKSLLLLHLYLAIYPETTISQFSANTVYITRSYIVKSNTKSLLLLLHSGHLYSLLRRQSLLCSLHML